MQYGVQLYTLRSLDESHRLAAVVDAGFDGVERVGLDERNVDQGDAAESLAVAAAHVDLTTLEGDPAECVKASLSAGTDTLVVPIVDEAAFEQVDELAARLDRLATRIEGAGGRLCYHNHEFEFQQSAEAVTRFDRLVEETSTLQFEVDVGWATAAGVDPVALIERDADRIPLVHLKDVRVDSAAPRGGVPVDLGEGDVDLSGCLRAARAAGVEWVIFEHDAPDDPRQSVHDAGVWLTDQQPDPR